MSHLVGDSQEASGPADGELVRHTLAGMGIHWKEFLAAPHLNELSIFNSGTYRRDFRDLDRIPEFNPFDPDDDPSTAEALRLFISKVGAVTLSSEQEVQFAPYIIQSTKSDDTTLKGTRVNVRDRWFVPDRGIVLTASHYALATAEDKPGGGYTMTHNVENHLNGLLAQRVPRQTFQSDPA